MKNYQAQHLERLLALGLARRAILPGVSSFPMTGTLAVSSFLVCLRLNAAVFVGAVLCCAHRCVRTSPMPPSVRVPVPGSSLPV